MSGKARRKTRKRAAMPDDVTELTAMRVDSVHAVEQPATGIPVLLMKQAGSGHMAKKTPEAQAARAERKLRKAQRRASQARYALAEAKHAASLDGGPAAAPALPTAGPFDDHLMQKAAGGDGTAAELLRKRGTDGIYASYARHVLKQATDPGLRAHAAGVLAALDEDFDPDGPLPRGTGSAW